MKHIADGILAEASLLSGIDIERIRGRGRIAEVRHVRFAVAYALRKCTLWSYPQIGRFLGYADHSSVIHAVRSVGSLIEQRASYAQFVADIMDAPPLVTFSVEKDLAALTSKPVEPAAPVEPAPTAEPDAKEVAPKIVMPCRRTLTRKGNIPAARLNVNDGYSTVEVRSISSMVEGSSRLAAAINAARAA